MQNFQKSSSFLPKPHTKLCRTFSIGIPFILTIKPPPLHSVTFRSHPSLSLTVKPTNAVNPPLNPMELSNPKRKRNREGAVAYNTNPNPRKSNDDKIKNRKVDGGDRETETDQRPVNDAEVEEFFAIMRRMANSRCVAAAAVRDNCDRWSPAFVWEDFHGGVKDDGEEKKKGLDLDLNADPEPAGAAPVSES